ncbi:ABC transporter substrate-binding protein [Rossellomorea marisflavi]|uniref:ABC transporter substrate-binding protein n=1 Tax=Rossellomorea marisflavi TaxID=189381 RepID=A0A0J5V6S6_9BACI|nr:ABC transporter substrate-binding protein [Rossellomorea marisflavi]KMK91580.1 ABC transporter substrate-binding protein [Rossellomorea marisflavi]KML01785.1 ABC transporter substrate-binding protein [Rossellomorea marisflavi]KML33552.1 ABC transporter substrate-binding protein [Rossellomorea marisflavi]KZE50112.1 ABC transporter substrate-binding protein [Rossellomorea marisflavi]QHA34637.1 ABC transporter substrate-binding protein [Rossellomorea marisflavi]
MKRYAFVIMVSLILASCGTKTGETKLPDDWNEIVSQAEGSKVNLFMWGGDEAVNHYIDDVVAPGLKKEYGISLKRVPMDTPEILQKLQTEKRAGKKDGSMDIVWMNGENFKNAKENDLLSGPITDRLPNLTSYYNEKDFENDFGTPTEGYEAPWGKVQFVFFYNSDKIDSPPRTVDELKSFVKEHPGKFTYPDPTDFTGNAFIRHLLNANSDQPIEKAGEDIEEAGGKVWDDLNEMKGDLWRDGKTYPKELTDLDRLFGQEEVWISMGYNEARAESLVKKGIYPEGTKPFLLEDAGSIGNTHFLSVPFNSPNQAGALVAIDYMLSPEMQLEKMQPDGWGDSTPISMDKLEDGMRKKFEELDRGDTVPDPALLEEAYIGEMDASYVEWVKEHWVREVAETD